MISTQSGSVRLFRFAGIQVFLHWSWFVVALVELSMRRRAYSSPIWNIAEYLTLFLIVLLHEFGHALATRQTGGKANEIILWPLGGVAFVQPPQRAGAQLWAIAAGPLVNVLLVPVIYVLATRLLPPAAGALWREPENLKFLFPLFSDLQRYLVAIWYVNLGLLTFNLLPVYPLDGGQIVRSLLWFPFGRARSLQIAAALGIPCILALVVYGLTQTRYDWFFVLLMGGFLGQQCLVGFRHARMLLALERQPRHQGFACPNCRQAPPGGPLWRCMNCGNQFDPFSTRAVCPHCATVHPTTVCAFCGTAHPIAQWSTTKGDTGGSPVIDV